MVKQANKETKIPIQKTQVQSLGQEDSLEKEVATRSSVLAWDIPWTEPDELWGPWGHKELEVTERLKQTKNQQRRILPRKIFPNDY